MPLEFPDNAVEGVDGDGQAFTSTPYRDPDDKTVYHSMMGMSDAELVEIDRDVPQDIPAAPTPPPTAREHARTNSFSFGQTVFHSLSRNSASSSEKSRLSDASSIFRSRSRASSTLPEVVTNDEFDAEMVRYSGPAGEQPDPFRMNATTYYTPQTMIPTTPPPNIPVQTQPTSKEDDIVWSLRTQLALQQELCHQYEIDLRARDEVVEALTLRCEKTEKEGERRRGVLRVWKKKVGELEKVCRGLEEEVERGREESWERSVMDEASGEALMVLQKRIGELEREKGEGEKIAQKILEEKRGLENVIAMFKETLSHAREQNYVDDAAEGLEDLKALLAKKEHASVAERERHRIAEFEWEEERVQLISSKTQVEEHREELAVELAAAQEQLRQKDTEHEVLKAELEAQWKHTESANEQMEAMKRKTDSIREEAEGLERRMEEIVKSKADTQAALRTLEGQVSELTDEVERMRMHIHELQQESADKEVKIVQLSKQRSQDKEDMQGLNIALDSKQQELELVRTASSILTHMDFNSSFLA
jgi:chromosome segregation ATPase